MVLSWRAPSISGGSGLACAVVPPAQPPTFLETGGLPLYPRRGLRPLHLAGDGVGVVFRFGASGSNEAPLSLQMVNLGPPLQADAS